MCLMSAASETGHRGAGGQTDIGRRGNGEIYGSGGEFCDAWFDWMTLEPVQSFGREPGQDWTLQ